MNASPRGYLDRFSDLIGNLTTAVAAVLLVGMFVLINIEVGMRYLMGASTLVADEYAGYMFAALVYLGLNRAIGADSLITVELPGSWARLMEGAAMRGVKALLILGLHLVLLYAATLTFLMSVRFQSRSISYSKTLLAWPQAIMVVGLTFACLAAIALMLLDVKLALMEALR